MNFSILGLLDYGSAPFSKNYGQSIMKLNSEALSPLKKLCNSFKSKPWIVSNNKKKVFFSSAVRSNIQPLAIKKECPKLQFTILGFAIWSTIRLRLEPFFIFLAMCSNVLLKTKICKSRAWNFYKSILKNKLIAKSIHKEL